MGTQMKSEFDKLKKEYRGSSTTVASVMCDGSGKKLCGSDVKGYPTILALENGKKTGEYSGERTQKAMSKWIKKHVSSATGEVADLESEIDSEDNATASPKC